jgi:hypothetical protein
VKIVTGRCNVFLLLASQLLHGFGLNPDFASYHHLPNVAAAAARQLRTLFQPACTPSVQRKLRTR